MAFALLVKKQSLKWVLTRWLGVMLIATMVMISFGDLSERFGHILKLDGVKEIVLKPFRKPPENAIPLSENLTPEQQLAIVATPTDVPPTPSGGSKAAPAEKPADVYNEPYKNLADYLATTSGETIHVDYSANALKYGLSAGIRLDTLWPNAIKAFKTNPLLGTGYSTLTKAKVWEFTVAESTDNDFLRLLGETGLLGLLSFMAIFWVILKTLWKAFLVAQKPYIYTLFAAGIGLTAGLLANALYIDVFEASKIAYGYWSLIGIILALAVKTLAHEKID